MVKYYDDAFYKLIDNKLNNIKFNEIVESAKQKKNKLRLYIENGETIHLDISNYGVMGRKRVINKLIHKIANYIHIYQQYSVKLMTDMTEQLIYKPYCVDVKLRKYLIKLIL